MLKTLTLKPLAFEISLTKCQLCKYTMCKNMSTQKYENFVGDTWKMWKFTKKYLGNMEIYEEIKGKYGYLLVMERI